MKISVTNLSDYQRGGAWPSSVRTVKRSVKSDNERDPHPYLPTLCPHKAHYRETAGVKPEEGAATTGQYAPNVLGYTRYKGQDNGKPRREAALPRNLFIVRIEGCNSPS